jgi:hypothetical protein
MIGFPCLMCRPDRFAEPRPVCFLVAATFLVFALLVPVGDGFAQDAINGQASEEDATSAMSREQWLDRVAAAKRRAQQSALEQRERSKLSAAPLIDRDHAASERVLNDDSLQSGDIVSTDKGLFLFRGRPDGERRESDFIALPPR